MVSSPIQYMALYCKGPLCDPLGLTPWTGDDPIPKDMCALKIEVKDRDIAKFGWDWKHTPHGDPNKLYPHCKRCLEHIKK